MSEMLESHAVNTCGEGRAAGNGGQPLRAEGSQWPTATRNRSFSDLLLQGKELGQQPEKSLESGSSRIHSWGAAL